MGAPYQGIPIQQIYITTGTVFIGTTGAAVSIGVLSTVANLQPRYMQIVSAAAQCLELHWGTPAATVNTNRVCLIPGLGTINTVPIAMNVEFPGVGTTLSIRAATSTAVTGGAVMINLWR